MKKVNSSLVFAIICSSFWIPSGYASETKLLHSAGSDQDRFGCAVALSGDAILVGAPFDDDNGENAGAVYSYQFNGSTWVQLQKFVAVEVTASDWFGSSIAIQGDQAIIGAPNDSEHGDSSGAVYIFRFDGSTWNEAARITDSLGAAWDQFGESVDIDGDYAFIGSPEDDDQGSNSGSVFIYHNDGSSWNFHQVLGPGSANYAFGRSLSADGSLLAIGADGDSGAGIDAGAVYGYHLDGTSWNFEQKVLAGDPSIGDRFGLAVALDGEQLLIGAPNDDDQGSDSGSVYVFSQEEGSWIQQEKIIASDSIAQALYGNALAISRKFAIVGAAHRSGVGPQSGSAYLLYYNDRTWVELTKFLPSDTEEYDYFSYAVAISEDYAVVGSPKNTDLIGSPGEAYVYDDFYALLPLPTTGLFGIILMILLVSLIMMKRAG